MFINYSGGDRFIKRAVVYRAPRNESDTKLIENDRDDPLPSVTLQAVTRPSKAAASAPAAARTTENTDSLLLREIQEQPVTLSRMLEEGWTHIRGVCRSIRAFSPEWINIAARGTSDNAARYAQYLFGAFNGLSVGLAAPSLFTLYEAAPRLSRALTIGISQSGRSPDIVTVVTEARKQGGATLAITNDPESPLAKASQHCIRLTVGEEKSVAATKTYTNQLMALAMLSAALGDERGRRRDLARVPAAVAEALKQCGPFIAGSRGFADANRFLVLARGFNYATAYEIALKMKEMSYVVAEPYSVADLLHGPVAMLEEGFPVMVVAPSGRGLADVPKLLDLLAERKTRIICLSDQPDILKRGEVAISLPAELPEWLSPIVAVVPGQVWARSLAIAKGHDPDQPRGLNKVTLTR
jgi:glucosamine--fructose-6-phosphate aminotransferase (isomerizing)